MAHLLIIDRDLDAQASWLSALQAHGITVTLQDTGTHVLAWASAHTPTCILLAVELPGISGYSICNRLKNDSALKAIPLVLASVSASDATFAEHRRLKTHAEGYVHKPYVHDSVLAALALAAPALGLPPAPEAQAVQPLAQPKAPDVASPPDQEHAMAISDSSFMPSDTDAEEALFDPLMSTDAQLLLEGAVDTSQATQVIRLPLAGSNEKAGDLIGEALADMAARTVPASNELDNRMRQLERTVSDLTTAQRMAQAAHRALEQQVALGLADAASARADGAATLRRALLQALAVLDAANG